MSKILVAAVGAASWEYTPEERPHAGTLKVTIPGRSQMKSRESDLRFDLRCFINDRRPAKRSNDPLDPLYDTIESPFVYFVDVQRHDMGEVAIVYDEKDMDRRFPRGTFKVIPAEHTTVRIQIFALRGVKVAAEIDLPKGKKKQKLEPLKQQFGRLTIDVRVNILQDRDQLPAVGEPPEKSNQIFPSFEADNDHLGGNALYRSLGRFSVKYIPNGIEFTWFPLGQTLRLELANPLDGRSGFSYYLNPEPKFPDVIGNPNWLRYDDLLHIRTSGNVKKSLTPIKNPIYQVKNMGTQAVVYRQKFVDPVAWARKGYPKLKTGKGHIEGGRFFENKAVHRPLEEARFFRIEKVESLADLEPPHTPFTVKAVSRKDKQQNKEYLSYYTEPEYPASVRVAIDLGVGFIPIIGDLVDFYELNLILATGKDRWGKDADGWDIFFAAWSIIPIIGIPADIAKRVKRTIQ